MQHAGLCWTACSLTCSAAGNNSWVILWCQTLPISPAFQLQTQTTQLVSRPTKTNHLSLFVLPNLTFHSSQVTSKRNRIHEQHHSNNPELQKKWRENREWKRWQRVKTAARKINDIDSSKDQMWGGTGVNQHRVPLGSPCSPMVHEVSFPWMCFYWDPIRLVPYRPIGTSWQLVERLRMKSTKI